MSASRPALVVRDPRFQEHRPPGPHPELPERVGVLEGISLARPGLRELEARPVRDEEVLGVHARSYLDQLGARQGESAWLDADTYVSPRSVEVARLAAGSTVELALRIARGEAREGFALVRPPGHHAEGDRAMGFCLLNQVAIAARALQREAGLERIAIVDWDVHHGNGTQHLFEADRDVLYLSLHQFPFYPGTGALSERGVGRGEGATLNLPLPADCGDAEVLPVFDRIAVPALREFRPQLVLVSAGFDAHARDPLASLQLSTQGYVHMLASLRAAADETCEGRLLLALEGGYDLGALRACVEASLEALASGETPAAPAPPRASPLGERLVSTFREAHGRDWASLRRPSGGGSA